MSSAGMRLCDLRVYLNSGRKRGTDCARQRRRSGTSKLHLHSALTAVSRLCGDCARSWHSSQDWRCSAALRLTRPFRLLLPPLQRWALRSPLRLRRCTKETETRLSTASYSLQVPTVQPSFRDTTNSLRPMKVSTLGPTA